MVASTGFGITLPSSGNVPSAFWEMLNWGAVDRIAIHHVTRHNMPIHNILLRSYSESISGLVSGTHIGPYTNHSNYTYPLPTTTETTISSQQKHRLGRIQNTTRNTNQSKDTTQSESRSGRRGLQFNNCNKTCSLASHTAPQGTALFHDCPESVKHKLRKKCAARKKWQNSPASRDKQIYNRIAKDLKQLLHT
jgi:hypothetical protein